MTIPPNTQLRDRLQGLWLPLVTPFRDGQIDETSLRRRPAHFRVLNGDDAQYWDALTDGADGAILLSAHVETENFAAVRTLLREGDRETARARWDGISVLTKLLFAEPSPAPAKYWLSRAGLIDSPEVRLPMVEVSAELAGLLDEEIERRIPPLLRRA